MIGDCSLVGGLGLCHMMVLVPLHPLVQMLIGEAAALEVSNDLMIQLQSWFISPLPPKTKTILYTLVATNLGRK